MNNPFDFGASLLTMDLESLATGQNKNLYMKELYAHPDLSSIIISIQLNQRIFKLSLGHLFVYLFSADRKYADIFDISFSSRIRTPWLKDTVQTVDYNFNDLNYF